MTREEVQQQRQLIAMRIREAHSTLRAIERDLVRLQHKCGHPAVTTALVHTDGIHYTKEENCPDCGQYWPTPTGR